jgi:uncharacterized repeat protein (TIGR03803 family)
MSCTQLRSLVVLTLLAVPLLLGAGNVVQAQTFSVVYNFGSQANDPIQAFYSGIIAQGRDGNLYSGSYSGGDYGCGAVFKLTPAGALTNLYSFSDGTDGCSPTGGLTLGVDGNFYGTSYSGGFGGAPYGTVFRITPGDGYTLLYTFTDGKDGALPTAPPIEGPNGLYGTTCGVCNGTAASSQGSIYKITPSGSTFTFTPLHTCDGTDCSGIFDPLILGTDGNFYGTSLYGGTIAGSSDGVAFNVTPAGKLTDLFSFDNTDGELPAARLVQGTDGNFYGTTLDGGEYGYDVVFKLTHGPKLTVLHNMNGTSDGSAPYAGLVQATDGNFYGANAYGGTPSANCPGGCGTIFSITPSGTFNVIHNFDLTDGELPYSTLFQDTNGLIYGMTQLGGTGDVDPSCNSNNCGVIYSVNIGAAPFVALVTSSGRVGTKIGILGQNFSSSSVVTFGTAAATTVTLSGTTFLTATVPSGATTGSVTVTTAEGTLNSNQTFRVTPQLKSFTPSSGPVGTAVTITGVSLTQTSMLTFGGVAASFTVDSDTQVTATVPTGAKTGKIVITTPGGTASSATSFTVTQ